MNAKPLIQTVEPVHVQVERFLRNQIQNGKLQDGERLPSTKELAQSWQVEQMSIQKAMTSLVRDGLIYRKRRRGTFVRTKTTQAIIGILMKPSLADEPVHFFRHMAKHIQEELTAIDKDRLTSRIYEGIDEHQPKDSLGYQLFVTDSQNYQFKGVVALFCDPTENDFGKLPIVRYGASLPKADARLDLFQFGRETLEYCVQRKCRKLFYLRTFDPAGTAGDLRGLKLDGTCPALDETPLLSSPCQGEASVKPLPDKEGPGMPAQNLPNIEIKQIWHQREGGASLEREAFQETLKLIDQWQTTPGGWPDAMMVSDDIATRGVSMAMWNKKAVPPKNFQLITLANEGISLEYGMPVTRYEMPMKSVAQTLVQILWKRINGEPLPELPINFKGKIATVHQDT
ncbi:MAG: GntR family transcriptional regulator [Verrucomicrobiae bacterium]|nr:GntR family transcriptional regulator [Verrucomicrobiae bacterium]